MNFRKFYTELWRKSFNFRPISQTIQLKPEQKLTEILRHKFPKATEIKVIDVSGGCGAMYEIYVQTIEFEGINRVKQHMSINEALKDEIKDMHGIRIFTSLPKE